MTGERGDDWSVDVRRGDAAELHAAVLAPPDHRHVRVAQVTRPALVLGSTQPDTVADSTTLEAEGADRVRRRTGGGAVLLRPGEHVWIDVGVPVGDRRWHREPAVVANWLGERWRVALGELGVEADAPSSLRPTPPASVCFAAVGQGEVVIGGRKAVGIAQRRSRAGVVLQSVALVAPHDPAEVVRFLAAPEPGLADRLRAGVEVLSLDPATLTEAVLGALVRD